MQLRIRVHTNSLLDYPGRLEKELSERLRVGGRRRGIEQLVLPAQQQQNGRLHAHGVGERSGRKGNEKRGKKKERKKDWDTCMCVRNNYPAYCRPLLPRKSLTSCWRAEKVRICCDSGKKRVNFSLRRAKFIYICIYSLSKYIEQINYTIKRNIHIFLARELVNIALSLSLFFK